MKYTDTELLNMVDEMPNLNIGRDFLDGMVVWKVSKFPNGIVGKGATLREALTDAGTWHDWDSSASPKSREATP